MQKSFLNTEKSLENIGISIKNRVKSLVYGFGKSNIKNEFGAFTETFIEMSANFKVKLKEGTKVQ